MRTDSNLKDSTVRELEARGIRYEIQIRIFAASFIRAEYFMDWNRLNRAVLIMRKPIKTYIMLVKKAHDLYLETRVFCVIGLATFCAIAYRTSE